MRSRIFFGSYTGSSIRGEAYTGAFAAGQKPSLRPKGASALRSPAAKAPVNRNKFYVGGIITTRSRLRWFLTGFGLFAFGIGYNFGFETGKITF